MLTVIRRTMKMMMKRAVTVLMKNKSANKICNINNIFHPNMIISSCLPPISMQKHINYVLFMPFDHATIINFDYDFVLNGRVIIKTIFWRENV